MGKNYYCRNQRINYWQFSLLVVFCLILEESIEQYKRFILLNYFEAMLYKKRKVHKKSSVKEDVNENLNGGLNEGLNKEKSVALQEVERKSYIREVKREGIVLKKFSDHISRYRGETVTIYVLAGGNAGAGFTGVVLNVNNDFVTIISVFNTNNYLEESIEERLGAIVDIPIEKIIAFVHNTI